MKCKITTGAGMRGLVRYQSGKEGAIWISGTQPTAPDFLRETAALRSLRPDCKKPVLHISLSLPEGEQLDAARWQAVSDKFLNKMNLSGNSHFVVRHSDTDHDHIHLAVNMIAADGKRWDTNKSALRAQAACAEIEIEFGLQRTRTLDDFRAEEGHRRRIVRDSSTNEFRRTGRVKSTVELAIQKRKAQREEQDRAAHLAAAGRDEVMAVQRAADQRPHPGTGQAHPRSGAPHPSAGDGAERHRRPVQVVPVPAAARPAAPVQKEDTMLKNLFKRAPSPQVMADCARIQTVIDEVLPSCSTLDDLDSKLQSRGIDSYYDNELREHIYSVGRDRSYSDGLIAQTSAVPEGADYSRETLRIRMLEHQHRQQAFGSIASSLPVSIAPVIRPSEPPTLSGRLMPVRLANGHEFDLFWRDRADGKPSFRWQSNDQRLLILASPNEKNVSALFDAAAEKGIGMPQITIAGTTEFQVNAAREAAKRGLPVDTSKLDEPAREIYSQTFDHYHGDAANAIASSAYESQDREEQRIAAERAKAEAERAKNDEGDDDGDRRPSDRALRG